MCAVKKNKRRSEAGEGPVLAGLLGLREDTGAGPPEARGLLLPEEPQLRQQSGVLLRLLWGGLRGLFVLQPQPLDLL